MYVVTGAFSHLRTSRYKVVCLHHGLPQILLSSCGLIKHSGPAFLFLYLSGDSKLYLGPIEGSQANLGPI